MTSPAQALGPYDPHAIEEKWYRRSLEGHLFHADPSTDKPPFSIVIPPPTFPETLPEMVFEAIVGEER